jgi:hypothetical protein
LSGRCTERILRLLRDGQWHDIDEIARRTRLSSLKMQIIAEFLAKYNFIKLDRENSRIKISRPIAKFFQAISAPDIKKSS